MAVFINGRDLTVETQPLYQLESVAEILRSNKEKTLESGLKECVLED